MSKQALYQNFINGTWTSSKHTAENINPSDTTDIIGFSPRADQTQTEDAIEAAHSAQSTWATSTPQQRFDVLDFIGTELLTRKLELGTLLSREEGKVLADGIAEVTRAGQVFKFFAGEALRTGGEWLPSIRPGVEVTTHREALGVIGIVTPWNFPMAIPAWKIAPALAYGNTIVFKPASPVPGCAWALTQIIARSGLPEGVFNLVFGSGGEVGDTIVNSPLVNGVTFTGSSYTGQKVAQACAARFAKCQLEMGGKNPLVVLGDADIDTAVHCAVDGAFFSTGQRCTASSRFVVTDKIHDQFVEAMQKRMQALKVGHALEAGMDIGPVADRAQFKQDLDYIEIGRQEGAELLSGGFALEREHPGFYLAPTLFVATDSQMRINQEEIFGPIASVIRVADSDEALSVANDTPFGLSAGVCTSSLSLSNHFRKHLQAGMVHVNLPTAGVDYHVPFGGQKQSSFGSREQGTYAGEFYTKVKTAYSRASTD